MRKNLLKEIVDLGDALMKADDRQLGSCGVW